MVVTANQWVEAPAMDQECRLRVVFELVPVTELEPVFHGVDTSFSGHADII